MDDKIKQAAILQYIMDCISCGELIPQEVINEYASMEKDTKQQEETKLIFENCNAELKRKIEDYNKNPTKYLFKIL